MPRKTEKEPEKGRSAPAATHSQLGERVAQQRRQGTLHNVRDDSIARVQDEFHGAQAKAQNQRKDSAGPADVVSLHI